MNAVIERFKQTDPAGRHRMIVAAMIGVTLLIVLFVGLPGRPADRAAPGALIITILIVALYFWVIVDPGVLMASAVAGLAILMFLAPSVLPTTIVIAALLLFIGGFAALGISIALKFSRTAPAETE